jgi:hypothetical protein
MLIALEGSVGDADLMELSKTVRAEPALQRGIGILYDCRGVTDIGVSSELIGEMGVRARKDTNRIAFIANSPVAVGLARMYQVLSEGHARIEIFSEEATALDWLLGTGGAAKMKVP